MYTDTWDKAHIHIRSADTEYLPWDKERMVSATVCLLSVLSAHQCIEQFLYVVSIALTISGHFTCSAQMSQWKCDEREWMSDLKLMGMFERQTE